MNRERLAGRAIYSAIGGASALVVGVVVLTSAPSTAPMLIGWLLSAIGAMALQAAFVGWVMLAGLADDSD